MPKPTRKSLAEVRRKESERQKRRRSKHTGDDTVVDGPWSRDKQAPKGDARHVTASSSAPAVSRDTAATGGDTGHVTAPAPPRRRSRDGGEQPPPPGHVTETDHRIVKLERIAQVCREKAARMILDCAYTTSQAVKYFCLSCIGLVAGLTGSTLNIALLSRVMAVTVGASARLPFWPWWYMSAVGSAAIVVVEIFAGVVYMDCRGATHILPGIDKWTPGQRNRAAVVSGLILLAMAGAEVGLAAERHQLMQDARANDAIMLGQAAPAALTGWMAYAGPGSQMLLAGVLPVVTALAGIALGGLAECFRIIVVRFKADRLESKAFRCELRILELRARAAAAARAPAAQPAAGWSWLRGRNTGDV